MRHFLAQPLIFLTIYLCGLSSHAQLNRYMVHFTDKQNSQYRIDQPQEFLSQRALERRVKNGVPITEQDFPVNHQYINDLNQIGIKVYFTTKWFNAALIEATPQDITLIETQPYVEEVEFVAPGGKLSRSQLQEKFSKIKNARNNTNNLQFELLGVDQMHEDNILGSGVLVAVLDAGFVNVNSIGFFSHLFDDNRLIHTFNYVDNSSNVYLHHDHGTKVFSTIAASNPGQYEGIAPEADFMLFLTEDVFSEYRIEEYNWTFATEFADSAGVDVINSSLGYTLFQDPLMDYTKSQLDGKTTVVARAAQIASDKGIIIVNSAGNEGNNSWQTLVSPADAEGVIAVGSVTSNLTRSSFSSLGPAADGRIKPDLTAIGSSTSLINANGTITTSSGTSFSSPQIAGLTAGIIQAFPDMTANQIKDVLKLSASHSGSPDNEYGYGIPSYEAFLNLLIISDQEETFKVYPNPIDDVVNISVNDPANNNHVELMVTTLSGQVLFQEILNFSLLNISYQIRLEGIPSGYYLISLRSSADSENFRIVKL